ncbi:MAG: hypothetical protein AAFW69_05110 [Pseudomonadota bacterium]
MTKLDLSRLLGFRLLSDAERQGDAPEIDTRLAVKIGKKDGQKTGTG